MRICRDEAVAVALMEPIDRHHPRVRPGAVSVALKRLARGEGAVGCALSGGCFRLFLQLSLQLATAVDGAVEGGGKQNALAQK